MPTLKELLLTDTARGELAIPPRNRRRRRKPRVRPSWVIAIVAALAVVLLAGLALAQPYPHRVIKMIVPLSPGGQPDVVARPRKARPGQT